MYKLVSFNQYPAVVETSCQAMAFYADRCNWHYDQTETIYQLKFTSDIVVLRKHFGKKIPIGELVNHYIFIDLETGETVEHIANAAVDTVCIRNAIYPDFFIKAMQTTTLAA